MNYDTVKAGQLAGPPLTIELPIGELAVFARRSGKTWYLFALNGEAAKTFMLPLSFLGKGEYRLTVLEDDRNDILITHGRMKATSNASVRMLSGGGVAMRFDYAGY